MTINDQTHPQEEEEEGLLSFAPPSEDESGEIDPSFWEGDLIVQFTGTGYQPNVYNADSDLKYLETLAYAYENNDEYAVAAMSEDDLLRVWGWIVKQRTGRYPKNLAAVDIKAKRLRRRELGPAAELIDFRVSPFSSNQASTVRPHSGAPPRSQRSFGQSTQTAPKNDAPIQNKSFGGQSPSKSSQNSQKKQDPRFVKIKAATTGRGGGVGKAKPTNPNADKLLSRGQALCDKGLYKEAAESFSEAIKLQGHRADGFYGRAYARMQLHMYRDARHDLDRALLLDSAHMDSYRLRAQCHSALNEHAKADLDYRQLLLLSPNDAVVHARRALTLIDLQKLASALEHANKAVELEPQHAWFLTVRAAVHSAMGSTSKALEDASSAVRLDQNNADCRVNLVRLLLANSQYDKAADAAQAFPASDPRNAPVLVELARDNLEKRNYKESIELCSRCLKLTDGLPYRMIRAQAYMGTKQFELAQQDLEKAVSLKVTKEQLSIAHELLAQVLAERGDSDRALKSIDESLAFSSKSRGSQFALRGFINARCSRFSEAESDWLAAREHGASEAELLFYRARVLLDSSDLEKCLQCYRQAEESINNSTPPEVKEKIAHGIEVLRNEMIAGAAEQANNENKLDKFFEAASTFPDQSAVYLERGIYYYQHDQFELALRDFDTVLTLVSNNSSAQTYRGIVLFKLARYADSLEAFNGLLKGKSGSPLALFYRGLAHRELGKSDQAVDDLKQSVLLYTKQGKSEESRRSQKALDEIETGLQTER